MKILFSRLAAQELNDASQFYDLKYQGLPPSFPRRSVGTINNFAIAPTLLRGGAAIPDALRPGGPNYA